MSPTPVADITLYPIIIFSVAKGDYSMQIIQIRRGYEDFIGEKKWGKVEGKKTPRWEKFNMFLFLFRFFGLLARKFVLHLFKREEN